MVTVMPDARYRGLGDRIRTARVALGLREADVADDVRILVPQQTVSRWERGQSQPHGVVREALAEVLRIEYHRLFVPEDVAAQVGDEARRHLLTARRISRGGPGKWISDESVAEHRTAQELAMLWLVAPDHRPRVWKVTYSGDEVLQIFQWEGQ